MVHWQNWSGKLESTAHSIQFLRTEEDTCALAEHANDNGLVIRAAGATHSHAPLVKTTGIVADLQGLSGVMSTETADNSAWIWAGSRIFTLGRPLHEAGLALHNQGDIDQQAIAGATATGTHGTGPKLKNLSAAVRGMTIATASGELITTSPDRNPDIFTAARQHLGAFGIVTRIKLELEPAYRLREHTWQADLDELLENWSEHAEQNRHFEFFWYPQEDRGQAKTINPTTDEPEYPLAAEGARCGWSYEVLPNHRPHKHTEMEYSVPKEHGAACMREIQSLLTNQFSDIAWPIEYRTLAADDVWLSTAYERDTVTISVHQDVRLDDEVYFRACEEIFLSFQGRPHWGKVNYLNAAQMSERHPRWEQWWQIRDELDPRGTFLNDYLRGLQPA
ncbi:MAG: FAD-binding protein [Pseudomonadales bacterium]|nr:FAD-binding protein [Pseudomonadales bacterium]